MLLNVRASENPTENERKKRVLKNVSNLLSLVQGEIFYNRTLGLPLGLIDKPFNAIEGELTEKITDLVEFNEPRARVLEINYFDDESTGEKIAEAVIDIV